MLSVVVLFAAPCAAFLAPGGVQVPVMRARSISMQEEAEAEPEPVAPPPAPTPVAAVAKKAAFGQDGVDYENTAFFKLCLASQKKLEAFEAGTLDESGWASSTEIKDKAGSNAALRLELQDGLFAPGSIAHT